MQTHIIAAFSHYLDIHCCEVSLTYNANPNNNSTLSEHYYDKNNFNYTLTYCRVNPEDGSSKVASHRYCPPQHGGSFAMVPALLERYPLLIEFSYLKMVTVMVLITLNKRRKLNGLTEVTEGSIAREIKNISYARKFFWKGNYFHFVLNFNCSINKILRFPIFIHDDRK